MNAQPSVSLPAVNYKYRQWQIPHEIKSKPLRKKNPSFYLSMAIIIDLVLLNVVTYGFLQFNTPLYDLMTDHMLFTMSFFLVFNTLAIIVASLCNVFQITDAGSVSLRIRNLFVAVLAFAGIMSMVYYYIYQPTFAYNLIPPVIVSFFFLASVAHFLIRYKIRHLSGYLTYAVVGGKKGNIKYLEDVYSSVYGKHAVYLGRFARNPLTGVKTLGSYQDVKEYIKQSEGLSKLVYFSSDLSEEEVKEIAKLCRTHFISFEIVPEAVGYFKNGLRMEQVAKLPVFSRKKAPLDLLKNQVLKRAFDLVVSGLFLITLYPVMYAVIGILIKLESKGPIYFKQKRTGYWNKPFTCYKFRTMTVNNDCDKVQAVKNDARITRIGEILRKTSLDEFPQFINVFRGEMSLVGPRPHMLKHTEDYSKLIDNFMIRHEVKPGITGWAQVNGWRGPTDEVYKMAKRVEFDVDYIEHWSFWFDLKCMVMTVLNIFKGESNAF